MSSRVLAESYNTGTGVSLSISTVSQRLYASISLGIITLTWTTGNSRYSDLNDVAIVHLETNNPYFKWLPLVFDYNDGRQMKLVSYIRERLLSQFPPNVLLNEHLA